MSNPESAKSSFFVPGCLYSGNMNGAIKSNNKISGTGIKNIEPHQKWLSKNPPNMGPSMQPVEKQVVYRPMAKVRSESSENILRMSEITVGNMAAPPMPMIALAIIRQNAEGENAANINAAEN